MLNPIRRLLTCLLALGVFSAPALAADKAIIILDASGSMWAQIDGTSRIEIARETLKQVLAGVSPELELGFMAYGHRSKGDCKDIETLVEPAAGTAEAISAAADTLSPKGKTPLSAAVKMAAETLKYTEDKATVILITDGIETCNADPCALASELKKAGVDFTVNVVGFGLSTDQGAQVKCLADNTGGKYISASDADGLKSAVEAAVNNTAPPPAPEPAAPEPVSDINFAPSVILSEGDDPLVANDGNIAWEFSPVKADGSAGEVVRTEYGNTYQGTIEPGKYIVSGKLDYAHASMPLTIEAGKVAKPVFDLEAGYLDIRPIEAEGQDVNANASTEMVFADGGNTTGYGEFRTFLPAGDTKVTVKIDAAVLETTIAVKAGERLSKDLVVGAGHVTVNSYYTGTSADMKVNEGGLFTEIVGAKKDIQGNRKSFTNSYGADRQFDLMPGDYVAIASLDGAKVEQPFSIKAGDAQALDIALNAGVLAISAPNAYNIEVFSAKKDIQGNRVAFGNSYDVSANRTLPAGDYHLVVTLANDAGTKEADATVKAGERNEITVE